MVGRVKGDGQGSEVHLEGPCGGDICIDRSGAQRNFTTDIVEVVGTGTHSEKLECVPLMVTFCSKYTRALTFLNFSAVRSVTEIRLINNN